MSLSFGRDKHACKAHIHTHTNERNSERVSGTFNLLSILQPVANSNCESFIKANAERATEQRRKMAHISSNTNVWYTIHEKQSRSDINLQTKLLMFGF